MRLTAATCAVFFTLEVMGVKMLKRVPRGWGGTGDFQLGERVRVSAVPDEQVEPVVVDALAWGVVGHGGHNQVSVEEVKSRARIDGWPGA